MTIAVIQMYKGREISFSAAFVVRDDLVAGPVAGLCNANFDSYFTRIIRNTRTLKIIFTRENRGDFETCLLP